MVTKENCKVVGAWSAAFISLPRFQLLGMMVLVMSIVFFDQCLKLQRRYAPSEHLVTNETKKNYNWLIVIGMISIFGGVAQTLMSLTMYWGVQKKLKDHRRVYLFCIGEAITMLLLITCLAVSITCKSYMVTKGLLNKNYEKTQEEFENEDEQVVNHIGGAFCLILAIDILVVFLTLLFLGFKLKKLEYDSV